MITFLNMLLYTINQLQSTGSNDTSLTIIYFISVAIAISVIIVKSPVVSILYLIGLFCSVAVYLVKSGMTFAGLIYLLVYVGAISILFIFIVMLLNVRISELVTEGRNSTILAVFTVISIYFLFSNIIPGSEGIYYLMEFLKDTGQYLNSFSEFFGTLTGLFPELTNNSSLEQHVVEPVVSGDITTITQNSLTEIASVAAQSWDTSLANVSHISSVGNIFYTILVINLIVVSLIILIAMIGAIVITVKSITKYTENELNTNISTSIYFNS